MTFSQNWHLINDFSHDEAAALWCGFDPSPAAFSHPDVIPIKRFIEGEHLRWKVKIDVDLSIEKMERQGKPPQTNDEVMRFIRARSIMRTKTVSRQWLTELALSNGTRPAFLFIAGAEGQGFSSDHVGPIAQAPGKDAVKAVPRSLAQEKAILSEIKQQGHKPMALPNFQPGKAGIKADIRAACMASPDIFHTRGVFDEAWKRLRASKLIADSTD